MPVLPHCINPLHDQKSLYQFLVACQQKSTEKNQSQIVSLTLEIDPVDLLAVLHELATPDRPHFYLEKRLHGEAIVAINAAQMLQTEGSQRFITTQKFIQTCIDNSVSYGLADNSVVAPRFFCNFTFFDTDIDSPLAFPSATTFLPQWQIVRQKERCQVTVNIVIDSNLETQTFTETIWNQFQTICLAKYGVFNLPDRLRHELKKWEITDSNNFKSAVTSILRTIRRQHLNKLVLAHAIDVVSRLPFQWIHSLHNLRQNHPDCYVFSTSNGNGYNFIGASPERLISISDRRLITDALAGSAPRGKTVVDDANLANHLLHTPKERHEHQVVVDFISQRLQQLGLNPQFMPMPGLLQLSNIQHLHTPIQAVLPNRLHPLDIVAELHPTPAVAGMPRDLACEHIRRYESFGRSLYAAPLGWVDAQGDAEFIVGIRSALINGHHARLYAGAGIVAGSQPDRELAEVKLKLQTLLQALV